MVVAGFRAFYESPLGLPDAAVHVWADHGFHFQRDHGRGRFHHHRRGGALFEYVCGRPHVAAPAHRSRFALHDLPLDPLLRDYGRPLIAIKQAFAVDLTSIAVIFTALSVGIGFGLQYLAADIASGFILLFERPIRVGDRITIGDDEGDVESINLRTTVISTNDRIAIIVPNSKLVGQRVINWSYGDPRARFAIQIGVAYDSDIDLVTKTLKKAAEGIANVLDDTPPRVQFMRFGDYALEFRLLVWTNQPRRHVQIRSDINYRINELFREREIRIPYPTQQFLLQGLSLPKDFQPSLVGGDDGPRMQD